MCSCFSLRASLFLPQYPVHRCRQIFHDTLRLPWPVLVMPGPIAKSIAAAHEDAVRSGAKCELHVAVAVADYIRAACLHTQVALRLLHHTEFRLAALATVGRAMRAIVD